MQTIAAKPIIRCHACVLRVWRTYSLVILLIAGFDTHATNVTRYDENPASGDYRANPPLPVVDIPTASEVSDVLPGTMPDAVELAEQELDVGARIDINTASAEQLASALPGIGPAKANAIVQWREANGPFEAVEQLMDVPGIGPKTLERLRGLVRIGDAVAAAAGLLRARQEELAVRGAIARIVARAEEDAKRVVQSPSNSHNM